MKNMLHSIQYQYTPGGRIAAFAGDPNGLSIRNESYSAELLGVSAQSEQGFFQVKGKGLIPNVSQILLLPVKGSKQLSLKMEVQSVESLITPENAWSALCIGPDFQEFNLRSVDACCDSCNEKSLLEFIAFSGDDNKDAVSGMSLAGWQASLERQMCPKCVAKK